MDFCVALQDSIRSISHWLLCWSVSKEKKKTKPVTTAWLGSFSTHNIPQETKGI
uniref:Uncharacterized protein n=1 Tax=Arion vulgaris TaxID=1028688 RepID=A0A0B6ZPA4_9EUPU